MCKMLLRHLQPEQGRRERIRVKESTLKRTTYLLHFAASVLVSSALHAQVVIIANENVKTSEITKEQLEEIFTGKVTTLPDGSQVVPLLNGGTAHGSFLKAYIGKSDAAYLAGWRELSFQGKTKLPKTFDGDDAIVEFVLDHPGTIAYIWKPSPHKGCKVLTVK